jgi:hypothetical protein
MALLGDIRADVRRIRVLLEDENGQEEEESGNLTAEDWAKYHKTTRMLEERIAYHEAKAREEEEAEARRRASN